MKNILLPLVLIIGLSTTGYSQEINKTLTYDEVEIGTVVNGNLVNISAKEDDSTVEFASNTIEITNNENLITLTDVEFIGDEIISNMEIHRYKCKNQSGDVIIFSVADGVVSIFNTDNNLVKTLINKEHQG